MRQAMRNTMPPRRMLWLIAGFTLWAVAFLALYMTLTLGCAYGWHQQMLIGPVTLQRSVLVVLFLLAVLGAGILVGQSRDRARREETDADLELTQFFRPVAYWVTMAAFVSTVATFVPVVALTTCY